MFQYTILKLSLLIQRCMLNRSFPHEVPKLMFPDNGDLARNGAMETGEMMYAQLCSIQFTVPETSKPLKCLAAQGIRSSGDEMET